MHPYRGVASGGGTFAGKGPLETILDLQRDGKLNGPTFSY
jgi:hypothetical protein